MRYLLSRAKAFCQIALLLAAAAFMQVAGCAMPSASTVQSNKVALSGTSQLAEAKEKVFGDTTATPMSERTLVPMPPRTMDSSPSWFLMIPPQRAYAADRSTMMGGPLATSAGEGGEEHGAYSLRSIDLADTSAPLSKWTIVAGAFASQQACDDYKAKELADLNDPAWVASEVRRARGRMIDLPAIRDSIEGQRCANLGNDVAWALLVPPVGESHVDHAASLDDRTVMIPMEGSGLPRAYVFHSVDRIDMGAPLTKWGMLAVFHLRKDCEAYKEAQIRSLHDPAWVAAIAHPNNHHLFNLNRAMDLVTAERCASGAEIVRQ